MECNYKNNSNQRDDSHVDVTEKLLSRDCIAIGNGADALSMKKSTRLQKREEEEVGFRLLIMLMMIDD